MIDFFKSIVELITNLVTTISGTADRIDEITFEGSVFVDYLGYAKYAMGAPLYTLFTSIILIAIGVSLWSYLVKGVMYIRGLL